MELVPLLLVACKLIAIIVSRHFSKNIYKTSLCLHQAN
jgi:hypothetical protein